MKIMAENLSISVVIITRNRAESLKDVISSLTTQSRPPDEVVVVDNASEDHTRGVALGFNGRLNIKYVYEEKRGIPYARNAGIDNAGGDIVAFIDDDCIADEDWLGCIEIPFIRDPHVGAVGGGVSYFMVENTSLEEFYKENMVSRGGASSKDS